MDINDPIPEAWHKVLDFFLTTPRCTKRDAYAHAYGRSKSSSQGATALWKEPRFLAELERRRQPALARSALKVEEILHHLHAVATADVRDLTEVRRCACRFCHGMDFKRQWRPAEFENALAAYKKLHPQDELCLGFDVAGGIGYSTKRLPHPDCPECDGEGVMLTFAKDMRNLTKAQAELIMGIKETDKGFEVKTRDKTKVIELAMRTLGMLNADKGDDEMKNIPPAGTVTWAVQDGDKDPTP